MKRKNDQYNALGSKCERGFTITEVVVVLAIMSCLAVIAIPNFSQLIRSSEYRSAARSMVSVLRETRSKAISLNLEHRVEFEPQNKRFRVTQGNKAYGSNDWNKIICDWQSFPSDVHYSSNVDKIHLNTDGTANGGTIRIQDKSDNTIYEVRIARTGRIRIPT